MNHLNAMRLLKTFLCLLPVLPVLAGCEPDDIPTFFRDTPGEEVTYAEVPVAIDVALGEGGTKAPVLSGADDARRGGVLFLVFRSATKQLDSYRFFTPAELEAAASVPLRLRVPLVDCDFYVLGNLLAVYRNDGTTADLMTALGADFPVDEASLEAMAYRLDGGALNGTWRRETMDEVRLYGIPFGRIERNVNVRNLISQGKSVPQTMPVWMFSKVVVRIDHGTFDGGDPAKLGYFTNKTFRIRQANLKLMPFADGPVRAQEAADAGEGDRDPAMTNAGAGEFVFFVPENMQGAAPASAFDAEPDPARKSRLKVPSNTQIPAACRDYGSYVEFTGTLDKSAGGFGGDVVYQFYLGANETTDFNLQRGLQYNILLRFTTDGLFHPDWRVQPSLTDSRLFRLTADPSFTTEIGDVNASRTLAVRKSRAGSFYLYMNPLGTMGGTNLLLGKDAVRPADFTMADLSDCSWYGDFMTPGTADAQWLADRGITPAWDKTGARLSFSVTDPARFSARMGEEREFSVALLPGGTVTSSFRIRLCPDLVLSVADGKSLTDGFYLGQKRSVTVSGFSGSTVKYAAVQKKVGASPSGALNANVQWKPTNSLSAAFPSCAVDGAGNVVYRLSEHAYDGQSCSGSLDVYAFYPNFFQASHGWESASGKIVFFTEDWWNDSLEAEIRVSEPRLKTVSLDSDKRLYLPIDGTPVDLVGEFGYYDYEGNTKMTHTDFDPVMWNNMLSFSSSYGASYPQNECITADPEAGKIYVGKTVYGASGAKLEELDGFSTAGIKNSSYYYIDANPAVKDESNHVSLWSGHVYTTYVAFSKLVIGRMSADGSLWNPGDKTYDIRYMIDKNSLADGVDVFTDDESFSMQIEYRFRGSDLSTLKIERTGTETKYTCQNGETFGPKFRIEADSYDNGSLAKLRWVYAESEQTMVNSVGEKVPGGLLLPYGEQHVEFQYSNRHDGRTFSASSNDIILRYSTSFMLVVGATRQTNAQVFLVPTKCAKYLQKCAAGATLAQRTWMTKLFGHRTWCDHVKIQNAYPYYVSGGHAWYKTYPSPSYATFPLSDFAPNYAGLTSWNSSNVGTRLQQAVAPGQPGSWSPDVYAVYMVRITEYPSAGQFGASLDKMINLSFRRSGGFVGGVDEQSVIGLFVDTHEVFAN